jgi:hypothetical protein
MDLTGPAGQREVNTREFDGKRFHGCKMGAAQ